MPEKIVDSLAFDYERTTKNTVRYQERERERTAKVIGTLYIQKFLLGNPPPAVLLLTIAEAMGIEWAGNRKE